MSRARSNGRPDAPPVRERTAISLFTGAGGLDLGFEAAGFTTRVAVEMDPEAVTTLTTNRPEWPVIDRKIDAESVKSSDLLRAAGLKPGEADILIGGPPCQPFSKSGYWASGDSKRLDDPRSDTLAAYLRVLEDTKPRTFLLENVPGLAFDRKDEGLDFLRRSIDAINKRAKTSYSFQVDLLRAVEFGVPQDRQRVFVVGSRDGTDFNFPSPTHVAPRMSVAVESDTSPSFWGDDTATGRKRFLSAWDAIGDLEDDDDETLKVTGKWADLLPSIPEGRNYLYHTARGGGTPIFGWRRRYWNFLLKLSKQLPSWTIAAQPGPAIGPFHWRNRRLSARELMRLQTFPEGYAIAGGLRSAQRQLGNAVPSALAEVLARHIRAQLLGDQIRTSDIQLLPKRRGEPRAAYPHTRVPKKYLSLVGDHEAHPGTGLGYGALRRAVTGG